MFAAQAGVAGDAGVADLAMGRNHRVVAGRRIGSALAVGGQVSPHGIYRWVAFLPSRGNERISVANRYFSAFQDGTLNVPGR